MNGWSYGEVWFELDKIKRYAGEDGSYIPKIVDEFTAVMQGCGQDISGKPAPTAADLFAQFSSYISFPSEAEAHDFEMLNLEWKGRAFAYPLRHLCGHVSTVIPKELETCWERGGPVASGAIRKAGWESGEISLNLSARGDGASKTQRSLRKK